MLVPWITQRGLLVYSVILARTLQRGLLYSVCTVLETLLGAGCFAALACDSVCAVCVECVYTI